MTQRVPLADKPITIYVRKGERSDERIISFRRPQDIPQQHILAAGMALDGNAVITGIGFDPEQGVYKHPRIAMGTPSQNEVALAEILNIGLYQREPEAAGEHDKDGGQQRGCTILGHPSLADALNCIESLLTVWLYPYGYNPSYE